MTNQNKRKTNNTLFLSFSAVENTGGSRHKNPSELQADTTSEAIRVLTFNGDGVQRPNTYARYGGDAVNLPGSYTLCLRFNVWVFRLLTAVLYLLPTDDPDEDRKMPALTTFLHV